MSEQRIKCDGQYKNGKPCRNYLPCKIHGENLQILHHKQILIKALEASLGVVTTACKKVNLTRQTFYDYMRNDAEFAAAVADIDNIALDFVESKLFEQIQVGNMSGISLYLKTKGRKRGYIETQEIDHKGSVAVFSKSLDDWEADAETRKAEAAGTLKMFEDK